MNRAEHLEWAKKRALEYADHGEIPKALSSFISDMDKHAETANHPYLGTLTQMVFGGMIKTAADMRKEIEGFG